MIPNMDILDCGCSVRYGISNGVKAILITPCDLDCSNYASLRETASEAVNDKGRGSDQGLEVDWPQES